MTDLKLDEFVDIGLGAARRIREKSAELTPVLLFWTPDGEMGITSVADYGNPAAKKPLQIVMRSLLEAKRAQAYVFVMETWFQTKTGGSFEADYLPSRDPQRKEGVFVIGVTRDGQRKAVVVEIKHRKDGGVDFGEQQVMPAGQIAGALAYLFGDETAH